MKFCGYVLFVMKRAIVLCPLVLCFACSDDTSVDTETSITSAGTGDSESGEEGSNFEPVPARGVTLTGVTANHGINVWIGQDGNWVGPTERVGRLVTGRDTLFRVYHELDEDWVEREIEARLLIDINGEQEVFTKRKILTTDTNDSYLDGALWFALPAEEGYTEPNVAYQVSLWEVEPGGEGLEEHVTALPPNGPMIVGFESIPMEMNVKFFPFNFNNRVPEYMDEAKMEIITKEIYQTEPITGLNTEMGALQTEGANNNMCNMLGYMSQLWSAEGAPANVYYVGMVDTGASSGIMGCATLFANINADVWVNDSMGITATSIVHEIGHNLGLRHVQCNDMGNPAADPDTSYPDHPLGRTLNTGFGIRDFSMYPGETTIDYMSYCTKRWVSPWTWGKIWPVIQNNTTLGSPFEVNPDPFPVLQLGIYPDGTTEWWTALSRMDLARNPPSGDARVEFLTDGKVMHREPARLETLSDGASVWVTVPMPGGLEEAPFDAVRFTTIGGQIYEVTRDEVRFFTQMDFDL